MNISNENIFSDFFFLEKVFKRFNTDKFKYKSSSEMKPLIQEYIDKNNQINSNYLQIKEMTRIYDDNFELLLKHNNTEQYTMDKIQISYMSNQKIKVRGIGYSSKNNYLEIQFIAGTTIFNMINFSSYEYLKISLYNNRNSIKTISHPDDILNNFMNEARTNKEVFKLMEKLLNINTISTEEKELDCLKYDVSIDNSCFYGTLIKKESEVAKRYNKNIKEAKKNDSRS